jgi:hypothetical protein
VALGRQGTCLAEYSRDHVYSLALAGDRLAWVGKEEGLCFHWTAHEETLGGPLLDLGTGSGCLGSAPSVGMGSAVGAGSLIVLGSWSGHYAGGGLAVDEQAIVRVEPAGCPCPALSSTPGPYTPLDVDGNRILVSGTNETRVLAADGTILLALPVPTISGQLSGSDLVLAVGGELRVYDAQSGALRAHWPLPGQPAGHPCDEYGDPSCTSTPLVLDDVSHGLAVYVLGGEVHVLRLADGADRIVGPGMIARFLDAGLAYADGARIRLLTYAQLPLS